MFEFQHTFPILFLLFGSSASSGSITRAPGISQVCVRRRFKLFAHKHTNSLILIQKFREVYSGNEARDVPFVSRDTFRIR